MFLSKPCTEKDRMDFIVEYNHRHGLKIEETEKGFYALQQNEYIVNDEIIIDNERYEKQIEEDRKLFIKNLTIKKADLMIALYEKKEITPDEIKFSTKDKIYFDCSNEFKRDDYILKYIPLTDEELDKLFMEVNNFNY